MLQICVLVTTAGTYEALVFGFRLCVVGLACCFALVRYVLVSYVTYE